MSVMAAPLPGATPMRKQGVFRSARRIKFAKLVAFCPRGDAPVPDRHDHAKEAAAGVPDGIAALRVG
jgi:hypothetical protein